MNQYKPKPRGAFLFAVLQQVLALVFASALLDGGRMLQWCGYGAALFWSAVLLMGCRGRGFTRGELVFVLLGYVPCCILAAYTTPSIWPQ